MRRRTAGWILVERSGINEFAAKKVCFDGASDSSGGAEVARPSCCAESVDRAIQLMKDDRVIQFLNACKNWRKVCIEYVIAPSIESGRWTAARRALQQRGFSSFKASSGSRIGSSTPMTKRSGYFWWT